MSAVEVSVWVALPEWVAVRMSVPFCHKSERAVVKALRKSTELERPQRYACGVVPD